MPEQRVALNGTLQSSVIADGTGNALANVEFQPLATGSLPTTFAEAIDWTPLVPEMFGAVGDVYNDAGDLNPDPTDDTDALNLANEALRAGQRLQFKKTYAHSGEFEIKGEKSYGGENQVYTGLYLLAGSNKNLAVADRWLRSDTNLGRRVMIEDMSFDANNAGNATGNSLVLCNFRPVVNNVRFANAAEDNFHLPKTLKNGNNFNSNAVGGMFTNIRSEGCTGRHLYAAGGSDREQTTYTDVWATNWTIGEGGTYGMYVEPASGWFVDNVHCSGLSAPNSLYFYGASIINVHNIYLEDWGDGDDTLNRYGIRVEKIKAGAGAFITNVGGNITSVPNTNVIQCMVSVEGGASSGQYAHLSNIHMDSLASHNYNLGINTNCATGGSLTIDYDRVTMTNFTRATRTGGGGGTVTFRDGGHNSWNYGTAAPSSVTNGSWNSGTEIRNTSPTNEIEKFLCTATGNPGTWRTIYRNAPLSGVVAPASTPSFVGQIYVDTAADKGYIATGTASSADWTALN